MVQRLHLTMEIKEKIDGSFEAHCPELSISVQGRYAEEVMDKLKEQVFSSLLDSFHTAPDKSSDMETIGRIVTQNPHCYLSIPRDPQVH